MTATRPEPGHPSPSPFSPQSAQSAPSDKGGSQPGDVGHSPPDVHGHGHGPAAEPAPKRTKRAQVSRACARCRRLQKGCSEARPCQRCIRIGLADECLASAGVQRGGGVGGSGGGVGGGFGGGGFGAFGSSGSNANGLAGEQPLGASSASSVSGSVTLPTFSSLDLPTSPQAFTSFPRESFQRQGDLLPGSVTDYCTERFFSHLCPTIPILSPGYVATLRSRVAETSEAGVEAYCVLVGMSAQVLVQVEEPAGRRFAADRAALVDTNASYGWTLLEEALAAHRHLPRRSNPSLEHVLFTFFIYACHAALFHHSQAFFFLRETTTLFLLLDLDALPNHTRTLADRLFWVLVVSERSHAIRYRRPTTLQITAATPDPATLMRECVDPHALAGFWSLTSLFRPVDTSFIATLNGETVSNPPSSAVLDSIESGVNSALNSFTSAALQTTQRANLNITQLWLRIIVWQVRLRLGYLTETAPALSSHTYHYPLEVAHDLERSTCSLDLDSMRIHGAGLTEKLFDIASVVVNVLARVPIGLEKAQAEKHLGYVKRLIQQLPGGTTVYGKLLEKHLCAALPETYARPSDSTT